MFFGRFLKVGFLDFWVLVALARRARWAAYPPPTSSDSVHPAPHRNKPRRIVHAVNLEKFTVNHELSIDIYGKSVIMMS